MAEVRVLFGRGAGGLWTPRFLHSVRRFPVSDVTGSVRVLGGTPGGRTVAARSYGGRGVEDFPLYRSKQAYYDILEVSPNATQTQIKTAYYKQSFIYHPDKNSGSEHAAFRFSQISEAYNVLGNKSLRRKYDRGILSEADVKNSGRPSSDKDTRSKTTTTRDDARHRRSPTVETLSQKVFDFDTFYREHYGEQLQRQRQIRERLEEIERKKEEAFQDRKLGWTAEIAVSVMLAMAAAILFSLRSTKP